MFTPRILEAFEFAVQAHGFQKRKYTNEPYVAHPIRVAQMVADTIQYRSDEDVIIAALLHDTVEDTSVTPNQIADHFGWRVWTFVGELTDEPLSSGNRKQRKELDNARLANASGAAQTIKCADTIDNTDSIVDNDPGFGPRYIEEKRVLLPLLEARAVPSLWAEATMVVEQAALRIQGLTERRGMFNQKSTLSKAQFDNLQNHAVNLGSDEDVG